MIITLFIGFTSFQKLPNLSAKHEGKNTVRQIIKGPEPSPFAFQKGAFSTKWYLFSLGAWLNSQSPNIFSKQEELSKIPSGFLGFNRWAIPTKQYLHRSQFYKHIISTRRDPLPSRWQIWQCWTVGRTRRSCVGLDSRCWKGWQVMAKGHQRWSLAAHRAREPWRCFEHGLCCKGWWMRSHFESAGPCCSGAPDLYTVAAGHTDALNISHVSADH